MTKHTLFELNEFIKRVLALNLSETVWISAEIAQSNKSRGHWYIELVEKDELSNQIIAQAQAILWARQYRVLKQKIGKNLNALLSQGVEVLIAVKVDFSERYGLKLIVEDIDPTYTLGQLALKKEAILTELKRLRLFGKNAKKTLPLVCQRVAVISSESAAGYIDFLNHIQQNEYGYQIKHQLYKAAMQGEATELEVSSALSKIKHRIKEFDAVVIIRGGGSKLDLAAFDNLVLSKAVADFPIPVLTGIGHEIDESILDLVAHTALKTPTAVADFLINRMLEFEQVLMLQKQSIEQAVQQNLHQADLQIAHLSQKIQYQSGKKLSSEQQMLSFIDEQVTQLAKYQFKSAQLQLQNLEQTVNLLSPEHALKRGFSMTLKDGKPIDFKQLEKGDEIETYLKDGTIKSRVL